MKMSKTRNTRWATAKCSTKLSKVPNGTRYDYKTKTHIPRVKCVYECSEDHNTEVYVNLNWKDIWLLKRNGQRV